MRHLLSLNESEAARGVCAPPKFIVTTHFLQLFQYNLLRESLNLKFKCMQFISVAQCASHSADGGGSAARAENATRARSAAADDERITFTYRIGDGVSNSSYAIECAKRSKEIKMNAVVFCFNFLFYYSWLRFEYY